MAGASLWLVAAILLQGAIAFVLLLVLGNIRLPLVGSGRISIKDIALSRDPWPEQEKRVSNAFDNQFQLPVLFYVGAGLSLYLGATWLEVLVAWLFVASRIAHAVVFATTNNVHQRFSAYLVGFVLLLVLWVDLAVRLVSVAARSP
jgi:hypothetical protein